MDGKSNPGQSRGVEQVMDSNEPTRRQFCVRTCQLLALGGIAATLERCGGGGGGPTSPGGPGGGSALPTVSGTLSGSTITVTVTGTALASTGTLALVTTAGGDVLVARTAADTFAAVSAACTHQACEITGFSGQDYVCPCHGSRFDTSGRVVNGPAVTPLRQFQTQFSNDVLTITA
jgi:nitrite reductase/ring-hydroxylating ferredoxin subunit